MATAHALSSPTDSPSLPAQSAPLLVSLSPLDRDSLEATLGNLSAAFPARPLLIATPDAAIDLSSPDQAKANLRIIPYTASVASRDSWVLTAPDYLNAYKMARDHGAASILLLGTESASLEPHTIQALSNAVHSGADLASPGYRHGPRDGLVNSAILYPVTRALYGTLPRFPLAVDLGLSLRMAERLATVAQRFTTINQPEALIWPLSEAAAGGFNIVDVANVSRMLPQPGAIDLNAMLARVTGSLFADADAKAATWQRIRLSHGTQPVPLAGRSDRIDPPDLSSMLDTFRIAYTNLAEIWSLVLPPNSLLGLKRLSIAPTTSFRMPDALWARTVYDFLLAYRLRTLNRGHLLGALTPLYLAWVASHLAQSTDANAAENHVQAVAAAFEAEKPYLVSRWRWPDRFNP